MTKQLTCTERVEAAKNSRIADLKAFMELDNEETSGEWEIGYYGLSWDYVEPDTFEDQPNGYYRYQISWGGPSEEFRYYTDAMLNAYKVEYWFLDWWDGASRTMYENRAFLNEIFEWFAETGTAAAVRDKALEQ